MICFYKKIFLRDLAKLPSDYRRKVERIIFEDIPESNNIFQVLDVRKMRGYKDYYRIRMGDYRIGCNIEASKIGFYRIKSRDDIYRVFP